MCSQVDERGVVGKETELNRITIVAAVDLMTHPKKGVSGKNDKHFP